MSKPAFAPTPTEPVANRRSRKRASLSPTLVRVRKLSRDPRWVLLERMLVRLESFWPDMCPDFWLVFMLLFI